jgi:hypothetical protein
LGLHDFFALSENKLDIPPAAVRISDNYVTRRFDGPSAGLKNPEGWIFAEASLYAISKGPN